MRTGSGPRTSVCRVERGLYALRYVEAGDTPGPHARLTILSGDLSFIPAPGRAGDALAAPGHAMIVRAGAPSAFEIQVVGSENGGTDAKFSIDMLDPGEEFGEHHRPGRPSAASRHADAGEAAPIRGRTFQGRLAAGDGTDVRVAAHVSRRGDVLVGGGAWVAGPDVVLPIEGLSIDTGRPDLGVRIRTQSIRKPRLWSRWHDPMEFAGSRQRADSLTAIALALTGDAAGRHEMVAEVMTLGMPAAAKQGRSIEFLGVDPIVGFRIELQPVNADSTPEVAPTATALRVFRAKR